MKFSDIKQFVSEGNWYIDVAIDDIKMVLESWERSYGLNLNPDFQRGHVWTEDQQIKFIEFILSGGRTAKVIYFNSPAFLGITEGVTLEKEVTCVDGVQRLTALLRFVNDEIKVYGHFYSEYEDKPRMRQNIQFNMNGLKTRKEVLEWYLQFNSGGTIHTEVELNRVQRLLELEK